jgi:protein SCO1/2
MAAISPTKAAPLGLEARVSALVGKPLFWVLFCGAIALFPIVRALSRTVPKPPALKLPLASFVLTDQRGHPFGSADLQGRVWVADFVFTSCPSVCPKLTKRMAQIQHRARNLGDSFHLVTITVDPENDTPERLAAYATAYHANPSRWSFLTGNLSDIEGTVVKGFKIAMGKDQAPDGSGLFSIFHGEKIVLVDADGAIRGYYEADDAGIDDLLRDADVLINTR